MLFLSRIKDQVLPLLKRRISCPIDGICLVFWMLKITFFYLTWSSYLVLNLISLFGYSPFIFFFLSVITQDYFLLLNMELLFGIKLDFIIWIFSFYFFFLIRYNTFLILFLKSYTISSFSIMGTQRSYIYEKTWLGYIRKKIWWLKFIVF